MKNFTTRFLNNEQLPLIVEPVHKDVCWAEFLTLLNSHRSYFQEKLLKHGGILFKGFPIHHAQDFSDAIEALKIGKFIDYIGGDSPRKKIIKGVYTSTEAPPSVKIPLHNELSFVKNYPKHIYFYCEMPSKQGGQTILCDARKIYRNIQKDTKERFAQRGLKYISRYPFEKSFIHLVNKSHKSWIDVFETKDKRQVEQKCFENEFSFQWNQNDWIEISQTRPAIISHILTKEKVWFNQAHLFDFNAKLLNWWQNIGVKILYFRKHTLLHEIFFADSTPICRKDLYHVLDVLDQNTIRFTWEKNDMLVLDNILSMHGRETFKGRRKILTAMTG